jgi:hypothetical protein
MSDEEDAKPPGAEIDKGNEGDRKQAATGKDDADNTSSDEDQGTKRTASERDNSDHTRGEDDPGSVKRTNKRRKASSSDGILESANSSDRASEVGPTAISLQEKWDEMFTRLVRFKVCYALTVALIVRIILWQLTISLRLAGFLQEKNGHCLVPNRYKEDPSLGSWGKRGCV